MKKLFTILLMLCLSGVAIAAPPSPPTSVTATPSTIAPGQSSLLNATSAGNQINWYDVPSGGTALGTVNSGANFSVSPSQTTTYYAESQAPGSTTDLTVTTDRTWGADGVYFSITAGSCSVEIDGFSFFNNSGGSKNVSVYRKTGGYSGSETNSGAWTNHGSFTSSADYIDITNLVIPANTTYSFYLYCPNAAFVVKNTNTTVSDSRISISAGTLGYGLFSSSSIYPGCSFTGSVRYVSVSGAVSATRTSVTITVDEYPTSLTATTISDSEIDLTWDGASAEFRVLRKEGSSSTSPADGTLVYEGTDKSAAVTGLTANTAYFFTAYGKKSGSATYSVGNKKAVASTVQSGDAVAQGGWLAGETGEHDALTDAGVKVNFTTGNSGDVVLSIVRTESNPGVGAGVPSGVTKIAPRYWTVTPSGTADGTYNITLDLTGIAGINNINTVRFLKRHDSGSAWEDVVADLGATINLTQYPYLVTIEGLTSFSDFTLGGAGDNPLPVELSAFSGSSTNAGIKLNWKTQSETDNAGFVLLRNGQEIASYTNTAALKGQGTTSGATRYSYMDTEAELGMTYTYKLRSFDISGQTHDYTQSVSVKMTEAIAGKTYTYGLDQNYPNPFNPSTTIRYQMKDAGLAKLAVYDVLGREVVSRTLQAGKGWNEYSFNAAGLGSGVYFYRLSVRGKFDKTMKMMLMK
ncbi:MAG: T9SS type A sorting domain-containing protein [Chlorobiales bacterium]|nr:T9SS type A sorting domain-containing protein [Chlorobiales bacterium]